MFEHLKRQIHFYKRLSDIFSRISDVFPHSKTLVCDDIERACDQYPDEIAFEFDKKTLTYRQFDVLANRYAHWGHSLGLKPKDTVAVFLPNRLEYVAIWYGLSKIGVISALINNGLVGQGLTHCLNLSAASVCLVDETTLENYQAVRGQLARNQSLWCLNLARKDEKSDLKSIDNALKGMSTVRPDEAIRQDLRASDIALYIYTSGTTGLPKAARISHARAQLYMKAFAGLSKMRPKDSIYIVLPLYHATGGLCGVGAAILNGARVVIKKRFSASQFWQDISHHAITHFVYIGELCRYLVNAPPPSDVRLENNHKLKMVFGNGLRPEIWETFKSRFKIPEIIEFYGSTEGNVSLFNLDGKPGAIGRVPFLLKSRFNVRLIKYDIDQDMAVRGPKGLCVPCARDEIGEAIGKIADDARHSYSGYADKSATEKKILRDVFEKGDAWFRTGDLMRQDREGYLYFVDRIGDTFRYKGENISTSEVAEYAAQVDGVLEAIVYGVEAPHHDGKIGMISLVISLEFDLSAFLAHLKVRLPSYALPRFVRFLTTAETTGTFKYKKQDLIKQGFDIGTLTDEVFVLMAEEEYISFTPELLSELNAGRLRL